MSLFSTLAFLLWYRHQISQSCSDFVDTSHIVQPFTYLHQGLVSTFGSPLHIPFISSTCTILINQQNPGIKIRLQQLLHFGSRSISRNWNLNILIRNCTHSNALDTSHNAPWHGCLFVFLTSRWCMLSPTGHELPTIPKYAFSERILNLLPSLIDFCHCLNKVIAVLTYRRMWENAVLRKMGF